MIRVADLGAGHNHRKMVFRSLWRDSCPRVKPEAHGLQPHRVDTFELSRDTEFVKKLRDVVGVDLLSPQRALVFCVDEKPQCRRSNRHAEPFIWTATAASILNKVRRCKEALKTAH